MKYGELSSLAISGDEFEAAHRMLAFCRKALNLPILNLHWFIPYDSRMEYISVFEEKPGTVGFISPKQPTDIWVKATLLHNSLMKVVAHECFHAGQIAWGSYAYRKTADIEKPADEFAEKAMTEYRKDDDCYFNHLAEIQASQKPRIAPGDQAGYNPFTLDQLAQLADKESQAWALYGGGRGK